MDDPNITMEEYIRLEEEKAQKRGKVSVEAEFPAIAFNDEVSSEKTLSCKPTVSSLNDEIDFKISFDDSDDEDYTVIFDKNSFSYKIMSTNDLKTNSENDNEKVNMPSLPPPEPTVSCFDDLDFFKDFENEFPTIVYNDAQTSKSDLLTGLILSPQNIDDFDLNDETSLSEYDEEEQNVFTVYRAYSLNEYSVFDTGINTMYPGDLVKEISTNIGGEFTSLEILKCWSLETSKRLFNTNSCSINQHGESTEQISGEFLILILFNSRI
ncbi:hypothetical protein Tco_1443541 [Tanacetum coccineum]